MRGFTVATEDYLDLAEESVLRFERFTGLPADLHVVGDGYLGKIEVCRDVFASGRSVFFDADMWFARPVEFPDKPGLWAPAQPFAFEDDMAPFSACEKYGIDPEDWFITSLVIAGEPEAVIWDKAAQMFSFYPEVRAKEEVLVNVAANELGIRPNLLHPSLNYMSKVYETRPQYRPLGDPIAYHAVGVPGWRKFNFLKGVAA